jgi:hypothetical protein
MHSEERAPAAASVAAARFPGLARLGGTALAMAGVIGIGNVASAALIAGNPNVASGTWSYPVSLSTGSQVQNGDFFVIYDFGGYVASSITPPAGWSAAAQLITPPPPGVVLLNPDDPTLTNLLFTRTGGTVTNNSTTTELSLGNFSASTTFTASTFDSFAYQDHNNNNPNGPPGTGQANVLVPAVPEPATAMALGIAGLRLLTLRRRGK